jgi:segregation and condensation protein A
MEIKSKLLLPQPEAATAEPAEDPRRELVRQLLEYKRYKEASEALEAMADARGLRLPRVAVPDPPARAGPPALRPVELWDLVSAFGRLLRETLALQPQAIAADPTPLHVYADLVLERLRRERRVAFASLFSPPHTRPRLVGFFLAVLELTRRLHLVAEQDGTFGDIWLALAPEPAAGPPPVS